MTTTTTTVSTFHLEQCREGSTHLVRWSNRRDLIGVGNNQAKALGDLRRVYGQSDVPFPEPNLE